jgi:daunorubicin resistance ABC transporter ATP-binding subunit
MMKQALYPPLHPLIGFIGCGNMGQPIARNLLRAGYALRVYDKDPRHSAELAMYDPRVEQVHTPGEAVLPGGIVVTMVPDDAALRQIVLGEQGILAHLGSGGIHLSLSTISPRLAEQLATEYAHRGAHFLSANVSGRPDVAAAARLSVYLAGNPAAKARVKALLEAIGKHIYDLGEQVCAANVVKLAANYLILAALVAMSEAATLVERAGVDRAVFLDAMAESPLFGGAVYREYGAAMIGHHDYQPALFDVKLGLKDATLLVEEAEHNELELVMAEPARHALQAALDAGRGHEDWSVLAEFCVESARPRPTCTESEPAVCLRRTVAPTPPVAIEIRDLCKSFGTFEALSHLSLTVKCGEIFGLLGPNGSGKTTTVNILSGLCRPTSGRVQVLGYDITRQARAVRRQLGTVPQETALYEELSAWTNLAFHADLFGLPRREKKQRLEAMLELVQLGERRGSRVKTFSGGMKRRLALARALLHDPELIYLDEPTLGVDVQSRRALWDYIRALRAQGKTILLTTNYLEEASVLCDRLAILDHGTVLAVDTPTRLRQRFGGQRIELECEHPLATLDELRTLPGIISAAQQEAHLSIVTTGEESLVPPILNLVTRAGEIRYLAVHESSLDDVFLQLTGSQLRDEVAGRRG